MLSDDSSSESDSGRFKSKPSNERDTNSKRERVHIQRGCELLPALDRSRIKDRSSNRHFERKDSKHNRRRSRDRFEVSRHRSPFRRRYSRDRSLERSKSVRDSEYSKHRGVSEKATRRKEDIEGERHARKKSTSPNQPSAGKRNFKEEIRKNIVSNVSRSGSKDTNLSENRDRGARDRHRERSKSNVCRTPEVSQSDKNTRSEIEKSEKRLYKENPISVDKEIRQKPEVNQHSDDKHSSDIRQPTSYYNLTPAKHASPEVEDMVHSITDSSEDEEKLRAKLLNLEKKLEKTKKKKSKKSKKKSKSKHKDRDDLVEVSSTTDIQDKEAERREDVKEEVSSTARMRKDSSEEGEICSDEEDASVHIDPSDLRHRLKRPTAQVPDTSGSPYQRDSIKVMEASPALPSHLENRERSRSPDVEVCGPQLPPHMTKSRKIGPTLPSKDMRKVLVEASERRANFEHASSEDEAIGPLPAGSEDKWTLAHKKLEERALHMKIRDLDGDSCQPDVKHREQWMLELPEAKAKYIGLGPRQFRAKEGPDMSDRSSWTDSPRAKALKAAGLIPTEEASTTSIQQEAHQKYVSDRDKEQEKAVKKHKKKHKREESLLEIHQKKMKKKKKKEDKDEGSARRPFSRDVDLQVNRFDDAQKRSIIKKAQELDSRFSSGKAKFL